MRKISSKWVCAMVLGMMSMPRVVFAEPITYRVDSDHTQPAFEVVHLGLSTYRGKFTKVEGQVILDREAHTGQIDVSIDPDSVMTGSKILDRILTAEDFFNSEEHPKIIFRSENILFEGDKPVRVEGTLKFAGKTQPVSLEIQRFGCRKHPLFFREMCGADAVATIRRSEFGMDRYLSMVEDEVRLYIPIEAMRE